MNATTKSAAPAITTDAATIKLLDQACVNAGKAEEGARKAAALAVTSAGTAHGLSRGQLSNAIVSAYSAHLGKKSVRDEFSASVAILCANVSVTVAGTEVGEKPNGGLTFKAPQIIAADEASPDGTISKTLTPADAVAKLTTNVLKQAAASARAEMGTAKTGAKGGRPPASVSGTRASFNDELRALCATPEGMMNLQAMLKPAGFMLVAIETEVSAETSKGKAKAK